jgi:hypothetical protein
MVEYFVFLAPAASRDIVRAWLAAVGGREVQAYGDRALIVELPEGAEDRNAAAAGIVGIHSGPAPEDPVGLDEVGRMGLAAWNLRHSPAFDRSRRTRIGEGRSWGDEEAEPEG